MKAIVSEVKRAVPATSRYGSQYTDLNELMRSMLQTQMEIAATKQSQNLYTTIQQQMRMHAINSQGRILAGWEWYR